MKYDSQNRVVERINNGTAIYYVYDGWDLIEERNGTGMLQASYVHGVNEDEMLTRTTNAGTVYYQTLTAAPNLVRRSTCEITFYYY